MPIKETIYEFEVRFFCLEFGEQRQQKKRDRGVKNT